MICLWVRCLTVGVDEVSADNDWCEDSINHAKGKEGDERKQGSKQSVSEIMGDDQEEKQTGGEEEQVNNLFECVCWVGMKGGSRVGFLTLQTDWSMGLGGRRRADSWAVRVSFGALDSSHIRKRSWWWAVANLSGVKVTLGTRRHNTQSCRGKKAHEGHWKPRLGHTKARLIVFTSLTPREVHQHPSLKLNNRRSFVASREASSKGWGYLLVWKE